MRLIVSLDTEEDNWTPARDDLTLENIREVPRFQKFIESRGLRPTYFTAFQVAKEPWAVSILQGVAEGGRAEIAAHLHPWNTPPMPESLGGSNTMIKNLATSLQRSKLEYLTEHHERVFGVRPKTFRAGRFGIGPELIGPLIDLGYQVDSSVTPYWNWEPFDGGPDFRGAPMNLYRLGPQSGSMVAPVPDGPLVELPVSFGFNRHPFQFWSKIYNVLQTPAFRTVRAVGLAWRSRLIRRISLSPEQHEPSDMLDLTHRLLDRGTTFLHMMLHSSSLVPGLTPFTPSGADVGRLYDRIDRYLEELYKVASPVAAVVADFSDAVTA